jgi:hypothetical protein
VQAAADPHWPLELQVCTPLPEHCFAPGTQTPVHVPPTHAEAVHATAELHVPAAEHVCTPLPEH